MEVLQMTYMLIQSKIPWYEKQVTVAWKDIFYLHVKMGS